ncbi:unnamed protein product [Acanthoscelides obtectus]|uniref:Uncharacterized protein n=1 Tax=Acanthoscelides obtectus TaxID=200917 RepID=A0A9P0JWQ9_ACAOB|nr:unnamed protein product [Acanthoscelides obtectus]CAK1625228.1 hypothetical protein AOBTE_LOCUS3047 [Acanthoscelides obtectus]
MKFLVFAIFAFLAVCSVMADPEPRPSGLGVIAPGVLAAPGVIATSGVVGIGAAPLAVAPGLGLAGHGVILG